MHEHRAVATGEIVLTGLGHVVLGEGDERSCDPRPYLVKRKTRKYMGPQDDLALVAAAQAFRAAGLETGVHGARVGLYLVVGYLPFEESTIDELLAASMYDGALSMDAFSTGGMASVNPLLSFRCLPNMPAFHICSNLGITGPYLVTYPGPGQLSLAIEQACLALAEGSIEQALVGGVADQRNFLVRHHFRRLDPSTPEPVLADAAGIMVLERASCAATRAVPVLGRLDDMVVEHQGSDPFGSAAAPFERFTTRGSSSPELPGDLGPASLPVALSLALADPDTAQLEHSLHSRDGVVASSCWIIERTKRAPDRSRSVVSTSVPALYRVVVTGMGVVSPLGNDVGTFRDRLLAGHSGVGPITLFDPAQLPTRIAAEAELPFQEEGLRDRKIAFALAAADQAMADTRACGSAPGRSEGGRDAGLALGVGLEVFALEDMVAYRRDGRLPDDPARRLSFLQTPADLCLRLITDRFDLAGPPLPVVSACAAGTDAIGAAMRLIASGRRRWMLAGGSDSMVNPLGIGGFCLLGATSTRNDRPQAASRPFDRDRDGFVLGEGAAVLVLERLDDAVERGAHIYAELLGYGCTIDIHGIAAPDPQGRGALLAMRRALAEAGIGPEQVDCINAHGTSTPLNDRAETAAIKALLGERAGAVPVCANKSMLGHLISAAGAVEAVAAIACMQVGRLPPTINLENPDPECDLDYVPQVRDYPHRCVLSTSLGFGGVSSALVIGRYSNGNA